MSKKKSEFVYTPLPNPLTDIRLLTVWRTTNKIRCSLKPYPLKSSIQFTAISYTWGDPNSDVQIEINGRSKLVRKNCALALQQACQYKRFGLFWIDSICIDQGNAEEKARQIPMMGEIYHWADGVLASLGEEGDDSRYLFPLLDNAPLIGLLRAGTRGTTRSKKLDELGLLSRGELSRKLIKKSNLLLRRPYFSRVWILQELLRARKVVFCCGPHQCDTERLNVLMTYLYSLYTRAAKPSSPGTIDEYSKDVAAFQQAFEANGLLLHRAPEIGFERKMNSIGLIMTLVAGRHCADRRDIVFGTLAITQWSDRRRVIPDYSVSFRYLAIEAVRQYKLDMIPRNSLSAELAFKLFLEFADEVNRNFGLTMYETNGSDRRHVLDSPRSPSYDDRIHPTSEEQIQFKSVAGWCIEIDQRSKSHLDESTGSGTDPPSWDCGSTCEQSSQPFISRQMSHLVRLNKRTTSVAQVCDGLQQGDWIVFCKHEDLKPSMVLRENGNGRYDIVGYALTGSWDEGGVSCCFHRSDQQRTFDLYIDLEDLLRISMWKEGLLNEVPDLSSLRLPMDSLQAHLSAPLTLSENSYAERPDNCWDPFR
jgi:hypothetical protein